VAAITPKATEGMTIASMSLFYILHTITLTWGLYFQEYIVFHHYRAQKQIKIFYSISKLAFRQVCSIYYNVLRGTSYEYLQVAYNPCKVSWNRSKYQEMK
jgi:hypothetical protein